MKMKLRKLHIVSSRLSEAHKKKLDLIVKVHKRTHSDYIRELLLKHYESPEVEDFFRKHLTA